MIDGSSHSFEDNIAVTRKVVEYAHDHGVVVEAELGTLAGIEDEVSHAVGSGVRLSFLLKGLSSPAEVARADLGDTLHICSLESVRASYRCRDDIVIRTTLDGRPLLSPCWLAFRNDGPDPRVRELAEKISAALAG